MPKQIETTWEIEPHTLAKHEILRRYLAAWFPIIASYSNKLVYIDGFCGPGRYKGGEPGSPIIAINQAIAQQRYLAGRQVTFLFIDADPKRIAHLDSELANINLPSNFYFMTRVGEYEAEFGKILDDAEQHGKHLAPTFSLIDPFGFSGFPLALVRRLLANPKSEVFINLMVDFINRFLEHPDPQVRQHIVDTFGTPAVLQLAQTSVDRKAAVCSLYQQQLSFSAQFVRYFRMCNERDQALYYMFFAGNHPLGHARMKEAFWRVDPASGFSFSDATNPDQFVLFDSATMVPTMLADELARAFAHALVDVERILKHVNDRTAFVESHMRPALTYLEESQRITVQTVKRDGTPRRKKTFPPNALVQFE